MSIRQAGLVPPYFSNDRVLSRAEDAFWLGIGKAPEAGDQPHMLPVK
jgi:hypothetical protein